MLMVFLSVFPGGFLPTLTYLMKTLENGSRSQWVCVQLPTHHYSYTVSIAD
jgi:hypothetical protein